MTTGQQWKRYTSMLCMLFGRVDGQRGENRLHGNWKKRRGGVRNVARASINEMLLSSLRTTTIDHQQYGWLPTLYWTTSTTRTHTSGCSSITAQHLIPTSPPNMLPRSGIMDSLCFNLQVDPLFPHQQTTIGTIMETKLPPRQPSAKRHLKAVCTVLCTIYPIPMIV